MSTPQERMRALRQGWALLRDIQLDATVPGESRERARALALRDPAPVMLQKLLASGARHLPQDIGAAIDTLEPSSKRCKSAAGSPPIPSAPFCTRCATTLYTMP